MAGRAPRDQVAGDVADQMERDAVVLRLVSRGGEIPDNPMAAIKAPAVEEKLVQFLTVDQLKAVIAGWSYGS